MYAGDNGMTVRAIGFISNYWLRRKFVDLRPKPPSPQLAVVYLKRNPTAIGGKHMRLLTSTSRGVVVLSIHYL